MSVCIYIIPSYLQSGAKNLMISDNGIRYLCNGTDKQGIGAIDIDKCSIPICFRIFCSKG